MDWRQWFEDLAKAVHQTTQSDSIRLTKLVLTDDTQASNRITLRTWKCIFTFASALQKTVKGSIYLAALVHYGRKVLVTGQGLIPIIEIDSDYLATKLQANMQ